LFTISTTSLLLTEIFTFTFGQSHQQTFLYIMTLSAEEKALRKRERQKLKAKKARELHNFDNATLADREKELKGVRHYAPLAAPTEKRYDEILESGGQYHESLSRPHADRYRFYKEEGAPPLQSGNPYPEVETFKCFADYLVGNTIGKNDEEGKRVTQSTLRTQIRQALQSVARFTGQVCSFKGSHRAGVVCELEVLVDEYLC
jgi:hypothetical protein